MNAPTPGQAALSPAFARWYRIGLPLAADDVLAAAWAYQHEAERTFWAEVDAAQEPHAVPQWPDGAPVRDADGEDASEPKAAPELAKAETEQLP